MDKKNKTDELFRSRFEQFEAEPPYDAWPALADKLAAARRRKRIAYWRWASLAAALLLSFFAGYLFQLSEQAPLENYWREAPTEQGQPSTTEEEVSPRVKTDPDSPLHDGAGEGLDQPGGQSRSAEQDRSAPSPNSSPQQAPSRVKRSKEQVIPVFTEGANRKVVQQQERNSSLAQDAMAENGEKQQIASLASDELVGTAPVATEGERAENAMNPFPETETNTLVQLSERQSAAGEEALTPEQEIRQETRLAVEEPAEFSPAELDALARQLRGEAVVEEKEAIASNGGFSIGLMAGPAVPFRQVNLTSQEAFSTENVANEKLQATYSAGVNLSYRSGGRWEFAGGLYVNRWQQENTSLMLDAAPESASNAVAPPLVANTSNGTVTLDGDLARGQQSANWVNSGAMDNSYVLLPNVEQDYRFLEIPLSAAYYISEGEQWSWKVMAGLSTRWLSGSAVQLELADGRREELNALRPEDFSLQLQAGSGLGYRVAKQLQINLMPTLRYGLSPSSESAVARTYFHQFLIYSGMSYRF